MDNPQTCRICLAENVNMYVVVNKTLHELYEKLTDTPFITEDSRPILVCFICCAQLKKCYRFQKKCLDAEERLAKIMNEEFESKPLINQDQFDLFHGFIRTPIDTISIVDVDQTESIVVKEELPAVCERLHDIIESKEEHNKDLKTVHPYNYLEIEIPSHHLKSQSEHNISSVELKIEFEEEQEVSETKQRVEKTKRTPVAKKSKLEETITAEQTTADPKIIEDRQNRSTIEKPKLTTRRTKDNLEMSEKPQNCTSIPVAKEETFTIKDTVCRTSSTKELKSEKRLIKSRIDDNKPFKCDLCQRSFANKYNLSIHNCIKPGEKPYKCDTCKSSFAHKGDLKNHTRIHTGEKPFKCETCESSFVHKGDLLKHNRIHTGEKPYKCNICQYSFSQKGHLSKHIRIHTGEKPYNCNVCQRSFSRKDVLTSHIRMHLGEKPFKCDTCQMNFGYKCDLTKHLRIHTGEKPYKCNICQLSYRYKSTLTKHSLIHTG